MTPTRSGEHTPTIMRRSGKESNGGAPRDSQLSSAGGDSDHRISSVYGSSGANFLISFLVDARGGVMENSRLKGLRLILPPQAVPAPTRITCKVVRRDSRCAPPNLQFSEGLGTRIVQFGPIGMKFSQPVCIEVPLCAATTDAQREFMVQRSENGESWSEHSLEVSDAKQADLFAALRQSVAECGTGEADVQFETEKQLRERNACRVFTTDFPAYFAVISRVRISSTYFDPEGGVLLSRTVNEAQAVFPEGALQKRIRIALQTHVISRDWLTLLNLDRHINELSPVLTIEPRRRKFHKPILLAIPFQRTYQPEEINMSQSDAQNLRLLCSIATELNGVAPMWEDITGSTQLKMVKNCVTFSTTVSAKYWLVDTADPANAVNDANRLYQAAASVPYNARCYVFVKPHTIGDGVCDASSDAQGASAAEREYHFRVFIACEDVFSKSLEAHENFTELARSDTFELRHGTEYFVELTGNLVAVHQGGDEQVPFRFTAFSENANRLVFVVRSRDLRTRPTGTFSIARTPKPTLVQQSKNPELFRPSVSLPLDLATAFGWQAPPPSLLPTPAVVEEAPAEVAANGDSKSQGSDVTEQVESSKSRHEVAVQSARKPQFESEEHRVAAIGELADILNSALKIDELVYPGAHKHGDSSECDSISEDEIQATEKQQK